MSITNIVTGANNQTIVINVTSYTFTKPFSEGVAACEQYSFEVYSRNDYSNSESGMKEEKAIPMGD